MDMEKNLEKSHFENDLLLLLGVWKCWQTFRSCEADLYKAFPIDSCFDFFLNYSVYSYVIIEVVQKTKKTCLPSPNFYQKCFLRICRAPIFTTLLQIGSTILLMGTLALDETMQLFEGHRGSLNQKRNMNIGFSRFRLVT